MRIKNLQINTDLFVGKGRSGQVFKLNKESCVKIFNPNGKQNIDTIPRLLELKFSNFYEIKELIYDDLDKLVGYIMKYYENNNLNLLDMPMEYFINNLKKIYNDFMILGLNNIKVKDLHVENIFVNYDKILLLDMDNYELTNSNMVSYNKTKLFELMDDILTDQLLRFHKDEYTNLMTYSFLLFRLNNENKELNDIIEELKSFETPMEYLRNKSKNR